MAAIVYNRTDKTVAVTADGDHTVIPGGQNKGEPGQVSVSPTRAKAMVAMRPDVLTLSREQALGALGTYIPGFTDAQREATEELTEKELCVVIKFLSAGRELQKPSANGKGLLQQRVIAWMTAEQTIPKLALTKAEIAKANVEKAQEAKLQADMLQEDARIAAEQAQAAKDKVAEAPVPAPAEDDDDEDLAPAPRPARKQADGRKTNPRKK